jgi:NADPH:quinone reductase-like Zn-dependent oxidoreductase
MKAIVFREYGPPDVLQVCEVEKPASKDNEVLIRVHAATVATGDCELRSFTFPLWIWMPLRIWMGLIKPRKQILGQDLAGEIEATGKDVKQFRKGDKVYAAATDFGAHAEYKCLPSTDPIAIMPANISYGEAASIPTGGYNALHFLRKANIKEGQKVLINGAGGAIGVMAVQLAKYYGAHVTGVDSTGKLDMLRRIGADHVVDFTKEDFTKTGETYDVIFDVAGKSPFSRSVRALRENGYYLLGNPRLLQILRGLWTSMTSSKKVVFEFASPTPENLDFLRELIEAGKIKPVIDRAYPLEQIAEAHTYVDTGRKKGNVVITMEASVMAALRFSKSGKWQDLHPVTPRSWSRFVQLP